MANVSLSTRDINVLEKIRDPEANPAAGPRIDATLPKDPHIRSDSYEQVSRRERDIVRDIQQLEAQLAQSQSNEDSDVIARYKDCVLRLTALIQDEPAYASARNNRAQALRRLFGDSMLIRGRQPPKRALMSEVSQDEQMDASGMALLDLDQAISLLSPSTPFAALSPHAAKTLALAHTQRGAIYLATSRLSAEAPICVHPSRTEASWHKLEFEEAASQDFALGGRYGNEIAKGLAVNTNPTAKLCGQMVRAAMQKEYGSEFTAS